MASVSSPRKNAETVAVETVAKLLRNGSLHNAERPDVAQAAEYLIALGLIETTVADYVRCVNHNDRDYQYVRNRSCRGRIRVDNDLDDDGDSFYCPECGRAVYPRHKARHKIMQVEVKPEKVAAFLEGILGKTGFQQKRVYSWVWRADTPQGEAKLVVADYCDLEHSSQDWAANNRACYVVVDSASCKKRFLPETWLVWTRLADIVCRPGVLGELLSSAAATVPTSQVRASVPVYSAAVRPVILRASPQEPGGTEERECRPSKTWPDPLMHTVAKCWTTKDGTFCLSTKTQGRYDDKVEFGPRTLQARLMQLLCYQKWRQQLAKSGQEQEHDRAFDMTMLVDLIGELYPEELAAARRDTARLKVLLKRLRSLISDIRTKKLEPSGINPDILPPPRHRVEHRHGAFAPYRPHSLPGRQ